MGARLAAISLCAVALVCAAPAGAAQLVGGSRQAALHRAFFAARGHRGQAIVSERVSTVAPAWALVRSVTPRRAGNTSGSTRPLRLQSAYFHLIGRRAVAARPPAAARADLDAPLRVAVVYSGSGSETIAYKQLYRSVCAGAGGFTDEQDDTVRPMSWSVRYVVDLDDVLSAVRDPTGTTIVPQVSFMRADSRLSARQTLARTALDQGCNGKPSNWRCTMTYALGPASSPLLSLDAAGGLEVGVPTTEQGSGACDPSDYTLGPSLWDSGATTALVPALGLGGATLPARPYRAIKVAWPRAAAAARDGFVAGPCQGDAAACRDSFSWHGTVQLAPVAG